MAGLAVLVFFVVVALAAPLLVSASELSATAGRGNPDLAPPSAEFPLGTDEIGRSVLAQLIWGARISLFIGVVATLVAVVIGSTIGVTAGFVGGRTERLLMAVDDWFLVIPFLPLAIVLAAVLGSSATTLAVVIGVTSWAGSGRLLRAQVLSVKERLFVERSRALGASGWHIVTRHVLPHTAPLILANAILTVPGAILAESTPGVPRLRRSRSSRRGGRCWRAPCPAAHLTVDAWWYYWPPGLCIVAVVLAFTVVGRALERILDPRLVDRPMSR